MSKRVARGCVAAAASALLAVGAVWSAHPASANTSGTVTSGSEAFKVFDTVRTTGPSGLAYIKQNSSTPASSGMRYHLVNAKTGGYITDPVLFANDGQTTRKVPLIPKTQFKIAARRDSPGDTNGVAPGSGNTTFYITVTWP